MITGMHAMIYSRHADKVQKVLSSVLKLPSVDAGEGWPIFKAPPTELAVHPTEGEGSHEFYLICDNIKTTLAQLKKAGIKATRIADRGWGLVTTLTLPGGDKIGLYEPHHPSPLRPKRTSRRKRG